MDNLIFVTSNSDKFKEAQAVLPELIQLKVDLPEIQEINPQTLIESKLFEATKYCKGSFIVEDQWLELDSLHGMPGPFVKWFMQRMGNGGIYELARKYESMAVRNRVLLGYSNALGDKKYFESVVSGTVVSPRGWGDFGWASIFQPIGSLKTYAEMDKHEKVEHNPRVHALNKLKYFLNIKGNLGKVV